MKEIAESVYQILVCMGIFTLIVLGVIGVMVFQSWLENFFK